MTRIDHAARSRGRMEKTLSSYETGEDAGAIVVALAALNDATLALVEQQRVANLINLAESGRVTTRGAHAALSALYDGRVEDGTARMSLSPDIAALLGIDLPDVIDDKLAYNATRPHMHGRKL